MKIIGVIPARYASSRFPGKPLADICGKPMIWWVYEQCKKVTEFHQVYVATDDERIMTTCKELGIDVMLTATNHANGTERIGEVATKVDGELFINIQGDEPLINPDSIRTLISMFDDSNVYYGSLKRKIANQDELDSPNVVKIITDMNHRAIYLSRSPIPYVRDSKETCTQFAHIGLYGYTREFLSIFNQLPMGQLERAESIEPLRAIEYGYSLKIQEVAASTIGVDTPEDLVKVQELIENTLLGTHN